jgi:transposase-like protein
MGKRQFLSAEKIEHHLTSQRQSGLTVERYCQKHHVAQSTFWYWRRRFCDEHTRADPQFVKVVALPLPEQHTIEVRTGPLSILIRPSCDESILRSVLSAAVVVCSGIGGTADGA